MRLIEKYILKRIERVVESEEWKVLNETLREFYGKDRFELSVECSEDIEWNTNTCNMHHIPRWGETVLEYRETRMKQMYSLYDILNKYVNLQCIIHFPIIEIKNRDNLKHTIRDLYVKLVFPLFDSVGLLDIDGIRTTISKNEYTKQYAHSHLKRGSFTTWENFCTGRSELGCSVTNDFFNKDKSVILQFLFLLQSYLEYESIEGVPYIKLEVCQNLSDLENNFLDQYEFIKLKGIKPPIKLNKDLKITNREEIEKFYADKCEYVSTKIDNKYYSILPKEVLKDIEQINNSLVFIFNNNPIHLKIDNYNAKQEPTKICHPKYTEAIIRYWENRILQKALGSNRITGENSRKVEQELLESNQISQ